MYTNNIGMHELLERICIDAFPLNFGDASNLRRFMELTNDDDKIKFAIQNLSETCEPATVVRESKSAKTALAFIEKANNKFSSAPWQSLVELYNKAVLYAPPNSSELARAYGNRSAALCKGGMYKASVLDVERSLSVGYPDNMKAKLYTRKARCFLAMDKKISFRVQEAIAEAREWLEKMDATNKKNFGDVLDRLPSSIQAKKPFEGIEYDKFVPRKISGFNSKIKSASSAIELNYSEEFGRHMVATRDIDAGETLVYQKSFASILCPEVSHKYCWQCSKLVWAGIACSQCVTVVYCSEFCRDEAWLEHHDIECSIYPKIPDEAIPMRMRIVLRLTVRAYKEAGSLRKLQSNLAKLDAITDPIAQSLTEGVYDASKYSSVYALSKKNMNQFDDASSAVLILHVLAASTDILGKEIPDFSGLLDNKWAVSIGRLIMKHIKIHSINSTGILSNDPTGLQIIRGGTLNPLISMFNHSCDPMVLHHTVGNMNAIIAIQKIKKGEQIFCSYCPLVWEKPLKVRRSFLLEKFDFCCNCTSCVQGWGPWLGLPSCMTPEIPVSIRKELRHISKKYPNAMMMAGAAVEDIPAIISYTFRLINHYQHNIKYPTQELIHFKMFLYEIYSRISF